jgi:ketosteroid isomerase-like protein
MKESGDWAYEVGAFSASAPDGAVLNSGKYIVIWKRDPNGGWKIHRDIFN